MQAAQLRRGECLALPAALVLVLGLSATGCGSDRALRQAVPGRVRLVVASSPEVRACLRLFRGGADGVRGRTVVERTGLSGWSLTFRVGRFLFGCDRAPGPRRRWCASAVGRFRVGRLVDPRLTLTCREARGRVVGFGWVEPVRGARWIGVSRAGSLERYAVVGRLPVRVTTTRVSFDTATFRIAQYGAGGVELERRTVVMHAAG